MAVFRLPLDAEAPHSRRSVQLEGVSYLIDLDWNERNEAWFVSVYLDDAGPTPIVQGFRVVIGSPVLRRVRTPPRPPGDILFIDTSGEDLDPGRDDVGARVQGLYYERADIEALTG